MRPSTGRLRLSWQTRQRREGVRQHVGKLSDDSANYHLFRLICRSMLLPGLILLERATERRGDRRDSVRSEKRTKSMYLNEMSLSRSQILRKISGWTCNDPMMFCCCRFWQTKVLIQHCCQVVLQLKLVLSEKSISASSLEFALGVPLRSTCSFALNVCKQWRHLPTQKVSAAET